MRRLQRARRHGHTTAWSLRATRRFAAGKTLPRKITASSAEPALPPRVFAPTFRISRGLTKPSRAFAISTRCRPSASVGEPCRHSISTPPGGICHWNSRHEHTFALSLSLTLEASMINVADFLLGLVTGAVLAFLFEVWRVWRADHD